MLQFIELLAVITAGTFGVLLARRKGMDFVGVVCNEIPNLFRSAPLYATCSFLGCWVYLLLQNAVPQQIVAITVGIIMIVLLRLAAVYWNIRLPEFSPTDTDDSGESL